MKDKLCLILIALFAWISFDSCTSECTCSKDLGCIILAVKKLSGPTANRTIATKTFCSDKDYRMDYILQDSVSAFQRRFTTDSTYVEQKDSIYKHYEPYNHVRHTRRYIDSGYFCLCPK